MAKLSDHSSSELFKLLLIGNSGAGKTGALASLVEAGYELRIIDFDSGLDALVNILKDKDPGLLSKVEFNSFRDKFKATAMGTKVDGAPKAYSAALRALEKWPDDGSDPASWGPKRVLVLDSLTHAGNAAFQWAKGMNPAAKEPRQWYNAAQDLIRDMLLNLTSDSFQTNVIVISHIDLRETQTGIKGYASSIGKALGPKIPTFFNTMILSEMGGTGEKVKRKLKTLPTAFLDLKNPSPKKVAAEYDIETGLAEIVATLKTG